MSEFGAAMPVVLRGIAVSGLGKATAFTQLDWVQRQFEARLGFRAWPGTFNVRIVDQQEQARWDALSTRPGIPIDPPDARGCLATCFPALVADSLPGAIILPHVAGYPQDQVELVTAESVRARLGCVDGDPVLVRVPPLVGWRAG
ncbi:MAG TPA: DUF120 domain-containing protein [Chloroflexota bacterium]|nr:DUF120 domain-containing protein [Chloroflexota bacterium]